MSKSFHEYPPEEQLQILKYLDSRESFEEKANYHVDKFGFENIMHPRSELVIEHVPGYGFYRGLVLNSDEHATYVGNLYVKRHKAVLYQEKLKDLKARIKECTNDAEVQHLLEAELGHIQLKASKYEFFKLGYENEKRRASTDFTIENMEWSQVAEGAATYMLEREFINKALMEVNEKIKANESSTEPHRFGFQEQYDLVLFYYYSGIYECLKGKLSTDTAVARALARFAGLPEKKGDSFRGLFTYVKMYNPKEPMSKKLFNKDSVNRTIDLLESMNFDATNLRQIRDKLPKD